MPTTSEILTPMNNPSEVYLNGVLLPVDVIIGLDGNKVIAESKIIDGVVVYERISRKPFEINFEFTCREQDASGRYIFPQNKVKELVENAWAPDKVIPVKNSFLNSLGLMNAVIAPITFTTIRGNTDVICSIKANESPDSNENFNATLIIPV